MLNTPLVADLIRKGAVEDIKPLMTRSTELGMQTFDQALYDLYTQGEISYDNAIAYADSANDLRLMIKLGPDQSSGKLNKAAQNLSLEITDEPGGISRFELE